MDGVDTVSSLREPRQSLIRSIHLQISSTSPSQGLEIIGSRLRGEPGYLYPFLEQLF